MPPRRIWITALCGVALAGFIGGGFVGLFGGGDGGHGGGVSALSTPTTTASTSASASSPSPSRSPKPTKSPTASITTKPPTTAPATSKSASPSTPAPPESPLTPGRRYVLTLADGRAMDVSGESTRDRAAVIAYPAGAGKTNQQWVVRDAGGGYVRLESVSSGKCLLVPDKRGAHAQQNDCGGGAGQLWKPQRRSGGVVLVSRDGAALGLGGGVGGNQDLALVPSGSASVWRPAGA